VITSRGRKKSLCLPFVYATTGTCAGRRRVCTNCSHDPIRTPPVLTADLSISSLWRRRATDESSTTCPPASDSPSGQRPPNEAGTRQQPAPRSHRENRSFPRATNETFDRLPTYLPTNLPTNLPTADLPPSLTTDLASRRPKRRPGFWRLSELKLFLFLTHSDALEFQDGGGQGVLPGGGARSVRTCLGRIPDAHERRVTDSNSTTPTRHLTQTASSTPPPTRRSVPSKPRSSRNAQTWSFLASSR